VRSSFLAAHSEIASREDFFFIEPPEIIMQHWINSTRTRTHGHSHGYGRRPRHNPDGSLASEAGMALLTTLVGAGLSLGIEKVVNGMTKEGAVPANSPEGSKLALYSNNQVSGIVGVTGLALGVGLHVNGIAPNVGKAVLAGTAALAVSRFIAHRSDSEAAVAAGRVANSRGVIEVAPVMVSNGYHGYLPSGAAVGAQYGTVSRG
jgi:hypothetical protein